MDLFSLPEARVPVTGIGAMFPVHRVYCVGRNYAKHVSELGGDAERDPPIFFLKPADCIVAGGGNVAYPPRTADLHHEVELVAALRSGGRDIPAGDALDCVYGYAVGIDLTRRDLQQAAKDSGGPWDAAKSFEQAAPVSAIRRAADAGHPSTGRIWLTVNGDMRQDADLGEMIWGLADAIAELSSLYTLAPGDLLFTGTPAGVGAIEPGDRIEAGVDGVGALSVNITDNRLQLD